MTTLSMKTESIPGSVVYLNKLANMGHGAKYSTESDGQRKVVVVILAGDITHYPTLKGVDSVMLVYGPAPDSSIWVEEDEEGVGDYGG